MNSESKETAPTAAPEQPGKVAVAATSEPAKARRPLLAVESPRNLLYRIPLFGFFWALYREYSRRNGPLLSAGIAYYAIFSLGPLVMLTSHVSALVLGNGQLSAQDRLAQTLQQYVGQEMAAMLSRLATQFTGTGSYTFAIVGLVILLYAAARLFLRLQASFNTMWDVAKVAGFTRRSLLSRVLVIGMILVPTLLLLVAVVLGTAFSWLSNLLGGAGFLVQLAQVAIPLFVTWLALLVIFVVLPDVHLKWKDCWLTALLVAIAWTVATRVLGIYLAWSGSSKYAGTVGALVGLLFWVNIMAIITLVGVRFNRALFLWRGKELRPLSFAAVVTEVEAESVGPRGL